MLTPVDIVSELLSDSPLQCQKLELHATIVFHVPLCWLETSTCIGNHSASLFDILGEDCSQSLKRSVYLYNEWSREGRACKHSTRSELFLQLLKRFLTFCGPPVYERNESRCRTVKRLQCLAVFLAMPLHLFLSRAFNGAAILQNSGTIRL